MSEAEDFEFRLRMEREAAAAAVSSSPSMLEVAKNAAYKGLAGTADIALNVAGAVGNALIPPPLRPGAMQNPAQQGLSAMGLIRPEHEPQTAGQRILDRSIQAGTSMLVGPSGGAVDLAKNVAIGAASGLLGGITREATGSELLAMAVGAATPMAINRLGSPSATPNILTPTGTSTLKDAQAAGYVVQPSTVKPSAMTNRLESVAGKAAVAQDASLRNQVVTNRLAAKSIGLPEDTTMTMGAIEKVREEAGKAYQAVADLSPKARIILDKLKQARADTSIYYKHYDRSADPSSLKKAQALQAQAERYENQLEVIGREFGQPKVKPTTATDTETLRSAMELHGVPPKVLQTQMEKFSAPVANRPDVVPKMRAARTLIARTYDVERALNLGDGNVSAPMIGRMLDKGRPLTGELKVIGKFAQAFPRMAREAAGVPPPSTSGTDAAASAMLATVGYGAAGGPVGLLAAGLPLARTPARNIVLSKGYQRRLLAEPSEIGPAAIRGALVGNSILDYKDEVLP